MINSFYKPTWVQVQKLENVFCSFNKLKSEEWTLFYRGKNSPALELCRQHGHKRPKVPLQLYDEDRHQSSHSRHSSCDTHKRVEDEIECTDQNLPTNLEENVRNMSLSMGRIVLDLRKLNLIGALFSKCHFSLSSPFYCYRHKSFLIMSNMQGKEQL